MTQRIKPHDMHIQNIKPKNLRNHNFGVIRPRSIRRSEIKVVNNRIVDTVLGITTHNKAAVMRIGKALKEVSFVNC